MIDLSTYSTGDYNPGSPFKRIVWIVVSRFFFETRFPWPSAIKVALLRCFGASVGEGAVIKPSVKIKYPWFLSIGDHCWIGENVWLDNVAAITIGNQVVLSQGAVLLTGNHDYKSKSFDLRAAPVVIRDFVWICAHAKVGPGVEVGEGTLLTLGSVATSSLASHGIYSGNPAERMRDRVMNE